MKIFKLSPSNLWALFLMAAFPTHVWTILLAFQDFAWMTTRNNSWDAVGLGAYGLLAAFVESSFVFMVALLLSLLLPRPWDEKKRLAALTSLIFIAASTGVSNQLYFLNGLPAGIFTFLAHSGHPLRYLYGVALSAGIAAPALALYFTAASAKFVEITQNIIERLALLTTLYLLLDFAGLVIVIVRNV